MPPAGTAVVTGASAGIGAEFARQLASRGFNLILVARRQQRLDLLVEQLSLSFDVAVQAYACDLADKAQIAELAGVIEQIDDLTMLVNNAGFGTTETIAEGDAQAQLDMLHVHMVAPYLLCRAALQPMIRTGNGAIINVSSIAAYYTGISSANYSATKAYLNSFSKSLQLEVKRHGIRVQALCPGYTITEFHDTETMDSFRRDKVPGALWDTPQFVVRHSLEQLATGKVIVIPGWYNRLSVLTAHTPFGRLVRPLVRWLRRR